MAKRAGTGIYTLEGGRKRPAFVIRAYDVTTVEKVKKTVYEKQEIEGEDGKVKTVEVPIEAEVEETTVTPMVDLVMLLEPEDEKKGASRPQVLRGFLELSRVQIGEGVDRFQAV